MNTRKVLTAQMSVTKGISEHTNNGTPARWTAPLFSRQRQECGLSKLMLTLLLCAPAQSAFADKGELDNRPSNVISQAITRTETPSPDPYFRVRLVEGRGVEVCEAYMQNLNSVRQSALVCERKFDPERTDFVKAPWRRLDPDESLQIAMMMYDLEREQLSRLDRKEAETLRNNNLEWERDRIARSHHTIYTADIDINNDGVLETVIKDLSFVCPSTSTTVLSSSDLVVLKPGGQEIDVEKTRFVNPYIEWVISRGTKSIEAGIGYRPPIPGSPMYDIFTYKGETYFDLAPYGITRDSEVLWVFQHRDGKTRRLCTYKYGLK